MYRLIPLFTILLIATSSCSAPAASSEQTVAPIEGVTPVQTTPVTSQYLKPAQLRSYVAQASPIAVNTSLQAPFDSLIFDRVVAYDFNEQRRPNRTALELDNQRYAADISQQRALNSDQVEQLLNLLTIPHSYGGITAACFDPRMAIVFYQGTAAKLVIDICLDCNFLRSSIEIPASVANTRPLDDGTSYPLRGFSSAARKEVITLAAALDLFYGQLGPEYYDYSIGE